MRTTPPAAPRAEVYSIDEVARAAGVSVREAAATLRRERIVDPDVLLTEEEAVHSVRFLAGVRETAQDRTPITLAPEPSRKSGLSLALSASLHALFLLLMGAAAALGLLAPDDTEELVQKDRPVRLVYMISPGPGGGGGGGGLRMPAPPPRAERKAVKPPPKPAPSVPRVRRTPPPPPRPMPRPVPRRPPVIEPPRLDPIKVEPPRPDPPQFVAAPIMSIATGSMERIGDLKAPPAPQQSQGPGTGGGVGSGSGTGTGPGTGSGLGPGSGGGTGGGPFRPGTGITPPTLTREVRATYTDDARRRGIEGDVVLEIVVRRDGSVGQVRVLRSLGAGLEQRAIDAVRQWRFSPSRRNGEPVDVAVEVAVGFKLR